MPPEGWRAAEAKAGRAWPRAREWPPAVKIVHLSMTPVAGAAWAASETFKEAGYDSRCIAGKSYHDGREAPADRSWPPKPAVWEQLAEMDLIFCHQGHPYRRPQYPKKVASVGVFHSQPSNVFRPFMNTGWPWGVIGQYQTRLYPGCVPLPNLVPLQHPWYQPGEKPADRVVIAFSPSNRRMIGWDSKGVAETLGILKHIDAQVDLIEHVPLAECLKRKSRAHIVIDECVTGSYHRSSLEGLALGCVVVNNADWQCVDNIRRMTGGCGSPFRTADLSSLPSLLKCLVDLGPKTLAAAGARNRTWMEGAWDSKELIERNYKPLMDLAVEKAQT